MKNLTAKLFIALAILGGVPSIGLAKANSSTEFLTSMTTATAGRFRLPARHQRTHEIFLNRGYATVRLSGDGDTDLDLYIYDSNGLIGRAEGYSDDEVLNLNIRRSDNFIIKVVNRGSVYNDYSLIVE